MSASYVSALEAARQAASEQHYPQGALYVVATPIGNLADISLRALHVLALADTIACEDTRHTQHMLRAYGMDVRSARLLALHQHNEVSAAQTVVSLLRQGQRVAYVSDAGTPGISDPGARLVTAVREAGLRAIALPGASSVVALLSVAGAVDVTQEFGQFTFYGFLPAKATERTQAVAALAVVQHCVVLLETPHRMQATAHALAALGGRMVTVGRELTKQFEEVFTLPAQAVSAWLAADANRLRGEFALVLHPIALAPSTGAQERLLGLLLDEVPLKTAVKLVAAFTGGSRNALYDLALQMKSPPE